MGEEKSKSKVGLIIVSVLLVVALVVNVVCFMMFAAINTFMTANLNAKLMGGNAAQSGAENLTPEQAREQSLAMAQTLESEGIVLLENKSGVLPLPAGEKVNLFGYASVDPIYGGTGSGTGDTSSNIDLIQGMTNAGFQLNQELIDFYKKSGVKRAEQGGYTGSNFTPAEVPASKYDQSLLDSAKEFSNTAIIMFSRIGGEGGDLPMDMFEAGYSSNDDGRSYLELTQDEEDLLELVKKQNFEKIIVLINSSNAMELGFLEDEDIDGALWIGSPGSTGMNAVGEALSGAVNPSGRLVDTYAYDLSTSPAYWNAGSFTYGNMKFNYVEYVEGIYVGYRFYETRYIDNNTGKCDENAYNSVVQYPFGYGMSYTDFTQEMGELKENGGNISVDVKVTNTGNAAGKDVVQIYYTAPYTVGGIEKSHVALAGFEKTKLLEPNESETVTVTFSVEDMASYDENNNGCYVLEAGDYQIKLMKNAHEIIDSKIYNVASTIVYGEGTPRSSDKSAAVNQFQDIADGQIKQYVSRADWEGTLPNARADGKEASSEAVSALSGSAVYSDDPDAKPISFAQNGLTLEDMAGLDYDDPQWEKILEQLSVEDMTNMISNGGWSTPEIASVGKPATNDLDGPAGINSLVSNLKGVSFPSEVVIGSTWNKELAEEFGKSFGAEASANHVVGLYAPGANIHRSPFSGRNFEYFAEDGLLNGKIAAAMIRGSMSQGVYCYVKHFALNDQESNRLSISVWANEQSIREIYLKPFEIAVKEGGTTAIMSSYSRIGTTWCGASKPLLTNVLRGEWGFEGMVITDSAMGNTSWMDVNLGIRAGNDMMLCLMGVTLDSGSDTAQQAMRRACHNILYTQANSIAVSAAVDTSPYWLVLLIILDAAVVSAAVLYFLKDKKFNIGIKVAIIIAITAVTSLIFWLCFFKTGSAPSGGNTSQTNSSGSSENSESEQIEENSQSNPEQQPAESNPDQPEGQLVEMSCIANGWLGCHVYVMTDGTFSIAYDYNEENSNVTAETGTWVENVDGTLTLTGSSEYTVTVTDNGDGSKTYSTSVVEANTSTTCEVSGTVKSGDSGSESVDQPEGQLVEMNCVADGWLGCHVYLMKDNTFSITYDYSEDNIGIVSDSGSWTENADGSLTLSGASEEYAVTVTDNGNGTTTYSASVVEPNTSVTCEVSGTVKSGGSDSESAEQPEGQLVEMNCVAEGWLGCHVYVMTDGTFSIAYDYTEDNVGIVSDTGTWTENEDGSLTLSGASGEYTVTVVDNGNGTTTYSMSVIEPNTSITCEVSGITNALP